MLVFTRGMDRKGPDDKLESYTELLARTGRNQPHMHENFKAERDGRRQWISALLQSLPHNADNLFLTTPNEIKALVSEQVEWEEKRVKELSTADQEELKARRTDIDQLVGEVKDDAMQEDILRQSLYHEDFRDEIEEQDRIYRQSTGVWRDDALLAINQYKTQARKELEDRRAQRIQAAKDMQMSRQDLTTEIYLERQETEDFIFRFLKDETSFTRISFLQDHENMEKALINEWFEHECFNQEQQMNLIVDRLYCLDSTRRFIDSQTRDEDRELVRQQQADFQLAQSMQRDEEEQMEQFRSDRDFARRLDAENQVGGHMGHGHREG